MTARAHTVATLPAVVLMAGLALSPDTQAQSGSQCVALNAHRVESLSARNVSPKDALGMVLAGTRWKLEIDPTITEPVTFRSVSGPADLIIERLADQFDTDGTLVLMQDRGSCTLRLRRPAPPAPVAAVPVPTPAPVAVPVAPTGKAAPAPGPATETVAAVERGPTRLPATLKKGQRLSEALEGYIVERGWSMRWLIDEDYVLDADVPVPAMDVIDGVTWVVEAYQAQGGLRGAAPRFARGNKVVVIEPMTVREVK